MKKSKIGKKTQSSKLGKEKAQQNGELSKKFVTLTGLIENLGPQNPSNCTLYEAPKRRWARFRGTY